ncbi:tRNA (adenosine(37)-N6)-threonylcarbamoyltransferase complex transferase subunit TsaD, partial [Candidatus Falkowbacteria bacterium]|nr:tRNA (adenosine(37)-N6)-threonylcarbamoyltransferase complex transferase subunit TsaD [Candidatus Falkowbacteria bacterium]
MIILGIETSCDETAAAVVLGVGDKAEVLSNIVSSQIEIHKKYGGVVPEVAAREHVLNILPVVNEALAKAKIQFPALILTVSGGHTMLVLMSAHGKYKVLGETRDDAAGEAFDKAAQL